MLIGREEPLRRLSTAIEATAAGSGHLVIVAGEAGVGKSSLLDAGVGEAASRNARILQAFCDPITTERPFGPLLDAVRGAGLLAASRIPQLLGHVGDPRPGLGAGGEIGSLVVEELLDVLEVSALRRMTALFVDDVHWADRPTLQTLVGLTRRLADLPLLLVVAARPGPTVADLRTASLAARGPGATVDTITLDPLDEPAAAAVGRVAAGGEPGPYLAAMISGCAGNPLLIFELVAALRDDGALDHVDGLVEITDSRRRGSLPRSFADAVRSRMARLDEEAGELATVASFLGARFTADELAAASGRSPAATAATLVRIVDAGVVIPDGETLGFRHHLVGDAIRQLVPVAVASGIESRIAERLQAAGVPLPQVAGHVVGVGGERGFEILRQAADEVLPLDASTAVVLARRALELGAPDAARRASVVAALVDGLAWSGRVREAQEVAADALASAMEWGDEVRVRSALTRSLLLLGEPVAAIEHAQRRIEMSERRQAPASWPRAELAACRLFGLELDGALDDAEQARTSALAERDVMAQILATCVEVFARNALGESARAVTLGDEAIRLADESPARSGHRIHPHLFAGLARLTSGDRDGARDHFRAGRSLGEQLGAAWALPTYHYMEALVHWDAGEWDELLAEVDAGLALGDENMPAIGQVWAHAVTARVHLHRGQQTAAEQSLDTGEALLATRGLQMGADWLLLARALLLDDQGRAVEAVKLLEGVWTFATERQAAATLVLIGADLARVAVVAGERATAERVVTVLADAARRSPDDVLVRGRWTRARGLLFDEPDLLVHAAGDFAAIGHRFDAAVARAEAAECLARSGRTAEAGEHVDHAVAELTAIGADRDVHRLRAVTPGIGRRGRGRPARRPTFGWEAVTPTEWLVVDEVCAGRSNGAVAELLGISRRTVEAHLRSIYAKVGVSTRMTLATARRARPVPPGNFRT